MAARRQLLEGVGAGRVALGLLRLLEHRQIETFEQDLAQLQGRVDVEWTPRLLVDRTLQRCKPCSQLLPEVLQEGLIDTDPEGEAL